MCVCTAHTYFKFLCDANQNVLPLHCGLREYFHSHYLCKNTGGTSEHNSNFVSGNGDKQ